MRQAIVRYKYFYNYIDIGLVYKDQRKFPEALSAFKKALELNKQSFMSYYHMARIYALEGNKDEAFLWLEEALKAGFNNGELLTTESDLNSIRDDKRFSQLVNRF